MELINKKLAEALHELNKANYEKEIRSLTTVKNAKGISAAVFRLKEKVVGPKQCAVDAVVVEDPETGEIVDDPGKIKEVTLNYCKNLLTDRNPKPGYEEIHERKKALHSARMNEKIEDDLETLNWSQFQAALRKVSMKHSEKYKFILNA